MKTTLRKYSMVIIEGQACQLVAPPRKTIDGTWLLTYRTEVGGRVHSAYATAEELDELAECKRVGIE